MNQKGDLMRILLVEDEKRMAQIFHDSAQGVIAVSVGNQTAGTRITLSDAEGNVLISYKPELHFAVVTLSTPELAKGEAYSLTVGTLPGTIEAN